MGIIIALIILGMMLALPIAVIGSIRNRMILRKMERVVDEYDDGLNESTDGEKWKSIHKRKLLNLKSKIMTFDKKSLEKARDLLNNL